MGMVFGIAMLADFAAVIMVLVGMIRMVVAQRRSQPLPTPFLRNWVLTLVGALVVTGIAAPGGEKKLTDRSQAPAPIKADATAPRPIAPLTDEVVQVIAERVKSLGFVASGELVRRQDGRLDVAVHSKDRASIDRSEFAATIESDLAALAIAVLAAAGNWEGDLNYIVYGTVPGSSDAKTAPKALVITMPSEAARTITANSGATPVGAILNRVGDVTATEVGILLASPHCAHLNRGAARFCDILRNKMDQNVRQAIAALEAVKAIDGDIENVEMYSGVVTVTLKARNHFSRTSIIDGLAVLSRKLLPAVRDGLPEAQHLRIVEQGLLMDRYGNREPGRLMDLDYPMDEVRKIQFDSFPYPGQLLDFAKPNASGKALEAVLAWCADDKAKYAPAFCRSAARR